MNPDLAPTYSRAFLPTGEPIDKWPEFRKVALTRAVRVLGPFNIETSEGRLFCRDGWVCIDARGYPYPVAAEEFALIYEPVQHGEPSAGDPAQKVPK